MTIPKNKVERKPLGEIQKEISDWLSGFIEKPHENLGRAGSVCPFVPLALGSNTVRITIKPNVFSGNDIKRTLIQEAKDLFERIKTCPDMRPLHVTIVALPDSSCAEIDYAQDYLKDQFVSQGLMLGEFHPKHNGAGLHNQNFKPMRSQIPMLIIREMVRQDYVFLTDLNRYSEERVQSFMKSYMRLFPEENSNDEGNQI